MRNKTNWQIVVMKIFLVVLLLGLAAAAEGCLRKGQPSVQTQSSSIVSGAENLGEEILVASLSAPDQVRACDPLPLNFTITNAGQSGVYILKWYTPLEGILGNIFQVTYQGQELEYLGPMVMRGDPLPENYIYLKPGEFIKESVNLTGEYSFHRPGDYRIQFRSPRISDIASSEEEFASSVEDLGPVKIPSLPVTVRVLPADGGDSCQPVQGSSRLVPEAAPLFHLQGLVREASPSLQVIWLTEAVDGFESIVLSEGTTLAAPDGNPLELNQVLPGMKIEAAGFPGEPGALLAEEVIISG